MAFGCNWNFIDMKSGGNINQLLKGGNLLLTYFLMKRQFLLLILSGSVTIFDLKKRGAVWELRSLK